MTKIRWIASSEASALHAAAALAAGRTIVDARLAQALADPTSQLVAALIRSVVPPAEFFLQAIPLACQNGEVELTELAAQAAERAIDRPISDESRGAIAKAIADLFSAQTLAIPDLQHQLVVRSGPLAEQWEARGPGLLARIGRSTDLAMIPAEVDVAFVYPACGGGGVSSSYNLVRIEAVLANPCAALPEVLRIGWLISQSNFKTLEVLRVLSPERLNWLAGMAMAIATLDSAAYVELARLDMPTLKVALQAWGLTDQLQPGQVGALFRWWHRWSDTPTDWDHMILALDVVLDSPELT